MTVEFGVLVTLRSLFGCTVEVAVEVLLPVSGSVTPPGAVTVAVFVSEPVALAGSFADRVKVAVPALARLTVVLMFPVPLAWPQLDPLDAVQVHVTFVSELGTVSVTVAPVTGLGPSFVTTMV